jgi:aspartate aminotransferase
MQIPSSRLTADPLFMALAHCAADQRANKIDLLVGVYRDEFAQTPVMKAVRLAEERIGRNESTKTYLTLTGREAFTSAILDLVVGHSDLRRRAVGLQTVGGSGALKLLFELGKRINPRATLWLSNPGYSGHSAIALGSGVATKYYPYIPDRQGSVVLDPLLSALESAEKGDFVVLHAGCHNPTGIDLSADQWSEVGSLCERRGLTPIFDVAYQGLGTGLESDVSSLVLMSRFVEYMMVAVSCSKTFGVYRERAGAALLVGPTAQRVESALQSLVEISFASWAVPPDHGAAIVETVLQDGVLRSVWQDELDSMRVRLVKLRGDLSCALSGIIDIDEAESIRRGRGIFSLLPLSIQQMRQLRDEFAIHGLENGRINVACLNSSRVAAVGAAIRGLHQA